ncbi:TPA: hypothetical protein N0F65_011852 [Lagenidium giganteum]|uniref:Uncharacterized protein n=1 Tax=Lagenidium giganteum TaxID=4803 RepID=A0AAV2YPF6_9STRA|nr:TPA: hypothetical protein N0F65_011852 [Lagenidium giganteum]
MVLNLRSASFGHHLGHGHGSAAQSHGPLKKSPRSNGRVDSDHERDVAGNPIAGSSGGTTASAKSKFSFDLSFFKKKKSAPHVFTASGRSRSNSNASKGFRPPPILTRRNDSSKPPAVRFCQSPGGRGNVQLAIPVTPTKKRINDSDSLPPTPSTPSPERPARDARTRSTEECLRLTVVLRESFDLLRASTIDEFLSCRPRDLVPDIEHVCQPTNTSMTRARAYMYHLIQSRAFEIRTTKWAPYFLQLVRQARASRRLTAAQALSVRWVIVAFVLHEVDARTRKKQAHERQLHKKMTEYRVALQCISGVTVLKYGRKGKPHWTQLAVDNGHTLRWTSKLLSVSATSKGKKQIPLASIVAIRDGPTTDVLARALHKGTLALADAKCALSLVTPTRTFDLRAKNAAEREWLHRSLSFLVQLAREHEKQVAQQVELAIMKRIEAAVVWKHGRKGRPHKTKLFINRFGEISWQGRSNDSLQLDEITAITSGHSTPVFARSLTNGLASQATANRCFSLVTPARTLDIETDSEQLRDWFVVAFGYLRDKVQEKTAALKRDKAEKQLKLLQELCGGIGITASHGTVPPPSHGSGYHNGSVTLPLSSKATAACAAAAIAATMAS